MNESMDRVLADWLREGPEMGPREGLERTLAATHRIGQRPGWTFPERWLPMQLTLTRTPSLRPLLLGLTLVLLILALVAAALLVGSGSRVPPPFGIARNGAVVFERDGALLIADRPNGSTRTLIDDSETATFPVFSNQGDRIAFVLGDGGGFELVTVRPDGSERTVLGSFPGSNAGLTWSPDGSALLMNFTETDYTGFRLAIVNADGSGSRELSLGRAADYGSWRPDGRHIVFRGQLETGDSAAYIAGADGANVRQLPIPTSDLVDLEGLRWSPDGARLSFMSAGVIGGTAMRWQIGMADVDASGAMTQVRQLRYDPASVAEMLPVWSPDGRQIAFILEKGGRRQIAFAPADGSGPMHLVGPDTSSANGLGHAWSPDGRTLVITILPRTGEPTHWSVDVASREATELDGPVQTWQRVAP